MPSEDPREAVYLESTDIWKSSFAEFDFPSSWLSFNLFYTQEMYGQIVARFLAQHGLSKSTFNVLMLLRRSDPHGMLLHDIGELLLVSRANITGLIDHLEQKRLVHRVVGEDRRSRLAHLTAKGRNTLDTLLPAHFRNCRTLMSDLSAEEKEALAGLLKKVRASLRNNSAFTWNLEDQVAASTSTQQDLNS